MLKKLIILIYLFQITNIFCSDDKAATEATEKPGMEGKSAAEVEKLKIRTNILKKLSEFISKEQAMLITPEELLTFLYPSGLPDYVTEHYFFDQYTLQLRQKIESLINEKLKALEPKKLSDYTGLPEDLSKIIIDYSVKEPQERISIFVRYPVPRGDQYKWRTDWLYSIEVPRYSATINDLKRGIRKEMGQADTLLSTFKNMPDDVEIEIVIDIGRDVKLKDINQHKLSANVYYDPVRHTKIDKKTPIILLHDKPQPEITFRGLF